MMITRRCENEKMIRRRDVNYKYTKLNHSSTIAIMTTIAEEVLTKLSSTTEQSGEGPVQPEGIAKSVAATQKSIRFPSGFLSLLSY